MFEFIAVPVVVFVLTLVLTVFGAMVLFVLDVIRQAEEIELEPDEFWLRFGSEIEEAGWHE
ncbi:hypothetical protein KOR42_32820 [Thalassoglobus neptunius]|uniref:Uncharacterized protein n=1 Tax=Thalassoglobus neptunius TaxID=1938619 RepID=A0A5C5WNW3_9PLAN|nr:hypothetical protein [Thalassoglobus neptunius]TWT51809.1 hypothetical protein KOR42_32820 [Thalassoglobus neptunius]